MRSIYKLLLQRQKLSPIVCSALCSPYSQFCRFSVLCQGNLIKKRNYCSTMVPELKVDEHKLIVRRFENIVKSVEDKRNYRGLELANGLRVLLISDPKTDKSAASMAVNVGDLMDPLELPGLAHFCEHMLFLGTAKYPSENDYSKFISSHGGMSNAFTAPDYTNYHFDISPEHLKGALDRFVQFFLCPLFNESATEREVCAVDSEFLNNVQNDQWRIMQLERSLSKPGHDYGKFGVGNKTTLWTKARENGIEPRDALIEFHKQYYSSDVMTCTVLGRESLDELEQIISDLNFGKIEKKGLQRKQWKEGPYDENLLKSKIEVVPVKDLRQLSLIFPIPDYTDEYRTQPTHYVSHLIGHEGPGSLLSEMKRRGWVSSLASGGRFLANGFGIFSISVDLSEEGLKEVDNLVELTFHEIGLLKKSGPLKWVQNELRKLAEIKFRFKDKETPFNYVTHLSSQLQRIPFEDILCVMYKMDEFKPELITGLLDLLTPDNMFCVVVSNSFSDGAMNTREKWYGTEYLKTSFTEEVMSRFHSAMKNGCHENLNLPTPNEYIATKFDLKSRDSIESGEPRLIRNDNWARAWFLQDNEFRLPKCSTKISIHSPIMSSNPMNAFLAAMYVVCFQDATSEDTYNPYLAGLSSNLDIQLWGLSLNVSGYDEKQGLFIKDLIHSLVNFVPDELRYEILKENVCRILRNFRQGQPFSQAHYYTVMLLCDKQWSKEQILACAECCEVEHLKLFIREALKAVHVETFSYGNVVEKDCHNMVDEIVHELQQIQGVRPLFQSEILQNRVHQLPKGTPCIFKEFQETHENGAVNYLMQTGTQNTRENVLVELIVQLAAEPAYNQLRTNEQLGYIVHTGVRRNHGTQGIELLIQGQNKPEYMEERIENFLVNFRKYLDELSEEEFRDNVEALATKRLEKPKTLNAKANRLWSEIELGFYHFKRDEVEVPVLRSLTRHDVILFFDQHFAVNSPYRRKLSTMIYGCSESKENIRNKDGNLRRKKRSILGDGTEEQPVSLEILDMDAFKSALPLYPLPQPVVDLSSIESSSKDENK